MNNELLGAQIAKYRKAAGITQEELGKAVGVSTQAVSRWECGGAPDVSLLPALADRLGVTIDTLFGRSEEANGDINEHFYNWLSAVPAKERLRELSSLLYLAPDALLGIADDRDHDAVRLSRSRDVSAYMGEGNLLRDTLLREDGLYIGVQGRECPFFLLMPEPPDGYASNLFSLEEYRALFALLGKPGVLEIFAYLHQQRSAYYTVHALAGRAGLDTEEAGPLLEEMAGLNLLCAQTIETERGTEQIYMAKWNDGFVPFLFLARWLIDPGESWRHNWINRAKPILTGPLTAKKEKAEG